MIAILREPLNRDELERLRASSKHGRVVAVVTIRWWNLLELDEETLSETLAVQVTGCRTGLTDPTVQLVGSQGDDVLLEVTGDPAELLASYDRLIEREAAFLRGDIIYGVEVPLVAERAYEQMLATGLHCRLRDRGLLRQRHDRGGIGLTGDATQFLDGTPVEDLSVVEVQVVQDTVWQRIEEWLRSREQSNV